jgi:hypothetical protein
MCGRYKLSTPGDELWESFDLHGFPIELPPHWTDAADRSHSGEELARSHRS